MLKISVRPELSMNSNSPALTPFSTLISSWSTAPAVAHARKNFKRTPRTRLCQAAGVAPLRGSAEGRFGGGRQLGRFISHEVGVLDT